MENFKANDTAEQKTKESGQAQPTKPRRSHKVLIGFGVFASIVLIAALTAGWYGIMPGVSKVMGVKQARDLGVRYTSADMTSYQEKTGITFADFATAPENPNRPGKKTIFADPRTVENLVLTQEELTAAANNLSWKSMPLDNVQIRAGDGVVEVSGNLNPENISSFIAFIGGVGYGQADVDKAADWAQKLVNNAPVYVKAAVSAENDTLTFSLHEATVGRFNMPHDIASKVLRTGMANAIIKAENYEIKSASFSNGQLNFSGTYPTTVYVAH